MALIGVPKWDLPIFNTPIPIQGSADINAKECRALMIRLQEKVFQRAASQDSSSYPGLDAFYGTRRKMI